MKKCLILVLFSGCAMNTTIQEDISYEGGSPSRKTVTTTKVKTLWDSGSSLTSYKATQTDKSQTTVIGKSEANSSSTNILSELEALANILKLIRPTP